MAHIPYLLVQGRFGNRTIFDIHYEAIVSSDKTDVQPLFEFIPLTANHDSVSISIGSRARDNWRDNTRIKTTDTLKQIANLFVLQLKLRGVSQMLILAAAAIAEVLAFRNHAVGRGLNDSDQTRAGEPFLNFNDLCFNNFANLNERNEDNEIFDSGDSFTTECNIRDGEGQVFANSGTHANMLGESQPGQKRNPK